MLQGHNFLNITGCEVDESGMKSVLSVNMNLDNPNYHRRCEMGNPECYPPPSFDLVVLGKALFQGQTSFRQIFLSLLFDANSAM